MQISAPTDPLLWLDQCVPYFLAHFWWQIPLVYQGMMGFWSLNIPLSSISRSTRLRGWNGRLYCSSGVPFLHYGPWGAHHRLCVNGSMWYAKWTLPWPVGSPLRLRAGTLPTTIMPLQVKALSFLLPQVKSEDFSYACIKVYPFIHLICWD